MKQEREALIERKRKEVRLSPSLSNQRIVVY